MNSTTCIFFILTIVIYISYSSQAYIASSNPVCYGSPCPVGTTRCKKHMKSSSNGYMSVTVNCLDEEDGSLKTFYFEEPTNMNPNTKYESTSYTSIGGRAASALNEFDGLRRNYNIEEFMP